MKTRFLIVISVVLVSLLGWAGEAAGVPLGTSITYQGVLSDGGVAADGVFDLRFTLVDAASGGSTVAGPLEVTDVTVSDGRITMELDFGDVFGSAALWLVVEVRDSASPDPYTQLDPRQKLTAAPQARHAVTAESAANAANLGGELPAFYLAWSNISGVPPELSDGDDDALGQLTCGVNQIPRWTGSAWSCSVDNGTAPVLSNTIYVARSGSPSGPGSIEQPFNTAQAGYDAAATAFPGLPATVVLMGGGGYGPLNMHAGTVSVVGQSRSELESLTVTFGIPSPPFYPSSVSGKQRVENVIIQGAAQVVANGVGAWVKFYNCRFLDGLTIEESYVEVQNCSIRVADYSVPVVSVGTGAVPITQIGIYQSSISADDETIAPGELPGALTVYSMVMDFEVIGCQIVNDGGLWGGTAPAILDLAPAIPPPQPLHLYSYNVIKGPTGGVGFPAVADSMVGVAPPTVPTIVFTHNTVYGDVGGTGGVMLPAGAPQFFANNTVFGTINFPAVPPAAVGWVQAGTGPGLDTAGNTEHPVGWGAGGYTLPSHWDD